MPWLLMQRRTLVPEDQPEEYVEWMRDNFVQNFQIHIPANKDPAITIPPDRIFRALDLVLDTRNHPILIHCNKGKVRLAELFLVEEKLIVKASNWMRRCMSSQNHGCRAHNSTKRIQALCPRKSKRPRPAVHCTIRPDAIPQTCCPERAESSLACLSDPSAVGLHGRRQ